MIQPPRILVVEDDPQIRQLNYLILTDAGYRVDLAEDGQAGWEAVRNNHYDLMLTDNSMPRLKGYQLIQKMRTAGVIVPVILVSSPMPLGDEVEFQGTAVEGRLLKPFRLDELLGMVKSVLAAHTQPPGFSQIWHAA
jgi:DNA-binding response OmpR family regulator